MFSFVGFETKEVPVKGRNFLTVTLTEDNTQLEADLEGKSGTLHMENYTDESTHISLEASK